MNPYHLPVQSLGAARARDRQRRPLAQRRPRPAELRDGARQPPVQPQLLAERAPALVAVGRRRVVSPAHAQQQLGALIAWPLTKALQTAEVMVKTLATLSTLIYRLRLLPPSPKLINTIII